MKPASALTVKSAARKKSKSRTDLDEIKKGLKHLVQHMRGMEHRYSKVLKHVHPSQTAAACNLIDYMALRDIDIRFLQENLHVQGLSSLGNAESHVRWQLNAVMQLIGMKSLPTRVEIKDYYAALLSRLKNTSELFGAKTNNDIPSIMVTFDTELAENVSMVKHLLHSGMNVARINCAHDSESVWQSMIWNVRKAVSTTGLACKIYMDLAGPKLRTVIPTKKGKNRRLEVELHHHFTLSGSDPNGFRENVVYCSEKGVVEQLKEGHRVLFDDGTIETIVDRMDGAEARLRVVRLSGKKPRIKESKGINFPDTELTVSPFTTYDEKCLPFIVKNADLIGYSFVKEASDVALLQEKLRALSATPPHIILKIETQDAVSNLPQLLLQGMKEQFFGVMIARGDLAVEIGIERLSEIQDEILWICEAAHVPAIWATQVLESLNKSGFASRSEATDAARSVMSECVMINKGTHLIEVVESLKDILERSGAHRIKKRYLFRTLNIAHRFLATEFDVY